MPQLSRLSFITVLLISLMACASHADGPELDPMQLHQEHLRSCADCGVVEGVVKVIDDRPSNRSAAVLGGVIGSIAGQESTAKPQQNPNTQPKTDTPTKPLDVKESYRLSIRMGDGRQVLMNQARIDPRLREGSLVRIIDNRLIFIK